MADPRMDPLEWLRKQLEVADVDLLREMLSSFVGRTRQAEAADVGELALLGLVARAPLEDGMTWPERWRRGGTLRRPC